MVGEVVHRAFLSSTLRSYLIEEFVGRSTNTLSFLSCSQNPLQVPQAMAQQVSQMQVQGQDGAALQGGQPAPAIVIQPPVDQGQGVQVMIAPQGGPPIGGLPEILAPPAQPAAVPQVPAQVAPPQAQVQAAPMQVDPQQGIPMQVDPQVVAPSAQVAPPQVQAQVAPMQASGQLVPAQPQMNYQQALLGQVQALQAAIGNLAMVPPLLAPQPQVIPAAPLAQPNAPLTRDIEQAEANRAARLAQQAIDQAGIANLGPGQVQGLIDHLMALQLSRASAPQTPTRPLGEGTSAMGQAMGGMPPANEVLSHLLSTIQELGLRVNTMQTAMQSAAVERPLEVVLQQSTPAQVSNPPRATQKYSPQKPSFLSMGFDEATEGRNLQDIKNVWLFSFETFARLTGVANRIGSRLHRSI